MPETTPPRWDLSNVFPGLDSSEFLQATNQRNSMLTDMEALITSMETLDATSDPQQVGSQINHLLTEIQKLLLLENTLGAYLHSFVSTESWYVRDWTMVRMSCFRSKPCPLKSSTSVSRSSGFDGGFDARMSSTGSMIPRPKK